MIFLKQSPTSVKGLVIPVEAKKEIYVDLNRSVVSFFSLSDCKNLTVLEFDFLSYHSLPPSLMLQELFTQIGM